MSDGRWRISVTAPDWGQDHLSTEAVVAYVDDELAHGPHLRASQHLAQCLECAGQVVAQGQTRSALRGADGPRLPSSLLSSLRSIPQNADLPAPPPGLSMTADGQFVSVIRPEREIIPTPERSDLVAQGIAGLGAAGAATHGLPAVQRRDHGRRPPMQRRIRLGTGVAVSGLAIGALAFGLPTASSGPVTPVPTATDRGVLGGPLLGGSGMADAQLRLTPTTGAQRPGDPVADRVDLAPGSVHGRP